METLCSDTNQVMNVTRRHTVQLMVSAMFATVAALPVHASSGIISAPDALAAATRGEITLVDIRTPGEWQRTGLAEPALAISMHEAGFVSKLTSSLGGNRAGRVALICATGGRSAHMRRILATAGFTSVVDVSEGMIGSSAGPGWLRRGLPIKEWKPK